MTWSLQSFPITLIVVMVIPQSGSLFVVDQKHQLIIRTSALFGLKVMGKECQFIH